MSNNENIEADRTKGKCEESNATVDLSQDNITHNESAVEIENNNDLNSDRVETAEKAVIVTDVQSVKSELATTHLETESVEPEKSGVDNEIIENEITLSESVDDSSLTPLMVKEAELESGVNQKAHDVPTPTPHVVTIHATAIVEKSPHTMFVEEEWDSLIRFIYSKEHLKQNIEKVRHCNSTSRDYMSGLYQHNVKIELLVKTSSLWETPRSYIWRNIGQDSWNRGNGTTIKLTRIHQK